MLYTTFYLMQWIDYRMNKIDLKENIRNKSYKSVFI